MRSPQVINLNTDTQLAFNSDDVIRDDDQTRLYEDNSVTSVTVDVVLHNITDDTVAQVSSITMSTMGASGWWGINVADVIGAPLTDRHKYVGIVSQNTALPAEPNMRSFKIYEFAIENETFEDVIARLPFQIEIAADSYIRWYDNVTDMESSTSPLFEAEAYEGGVGTTWATEPSRVTHRGPIVKI